MITATHNRPLVAHRYIDARTLEPGQMIVFSEPDVGRVEFVSSRPATSNAAAGALVIVGRRPGGRPFETVLIRDRHYGHPRVCVEAEFTEREVEQIEGFEAKILDGTVFRNVAASLGSAIGYRPPSGTRSYAGALAALAAGATSDRQATLVAAAVKALTPHAHGPEETMRYVWQAVADELARGWFDTIGNAGPEAGRRSSHEHDYTLADRVRIFVTLKAAQDCYPTGGAGGLGWCMDAIARREGVRS